MKNEDESRSGNRMEPDIPQKDPVDLQEQINRLNEKILDLQSENEALLNDNRELLALRDEIFESKAWKLIRFLRRIRLFMAPRHSLAEKFGGEGVKLFKNLRIRENLSGVLPQKNQTALLALLEENKDAKDIIIFAPSVYWDIALFQRPQHLAIHFAQRGILTLFLETQHSRSPAGFTKIKDRLYLCKVPLDTFKIIDHPAVVFLSYNKNQLKHFTNPRIIYEFIDELIVFPGNYSQILKDHQEFLKIAQIVTATAKRLYDQITPFRPDALLVLNGVNYEHFYRSPDENVSVPQDLAPYLNKGDAVIGYYGALAKWFDYELLKKLALLRPDLTFLLIGPAYDNSLSNSGIEQIPNIHWLGTKDYDTLPGYLHAFDVAMIPFQLNAITHSTSPLKLFEYMAGHKPVVISPMNESMRIDGVLVADGVEEFSKKIDQALALRFDPEYIQRIDRVARENTWDHRCRQILDALERTSMKSDQAGCEPEK
jgi:hypothetical protein